MKNIEHILNDCLNKAMCQKGRIQKPNSNNIAEFVSKYLENEKLALINVSQQGEFLDWLSDEDYFNIPKDEIDEILQDWQYYKSNCI